MKKEYIFDNDWEGDLMLRETGGYYDYNDRGKYVYKITDKATLEELRTVNMLGDNIKAMFYVAYLNFKYK
jgi:hypothetical protein